MQISLPKWNKKSKPTQPQKKGRKKERKKNHNEVEIFMLGPF